MSANDITTNNAVAIDQVSSPEKNEKIDEKSASSSKNERDVEKLSAQVEQQEGDAESAGSHPRKLNKTPAQRRIGNIQFGSICFCALLLGWNDGSVGPLLPRIQEVYDVNFTVVSLVFVTSCVGFIVGALTNMWLGPKIGMGKTLALGTALQVVTYCVQAPGPHFGAFVAMNVVNGIGLAFQHAQGNGFVGALTEKPETKMGFLHACYGIGAFAAPLVATQFAQMRRWSFHYLCSLGLATVNTLVVIVVFKFRRQEVSLAAAGEPVKHQEEPSQNPSPEATTIDGTAAEVAAPTQQVEDTSVKRVLSTPAVHGLAFFLLVYVGVEVTLGGWIVTYIINERGGGSSAGYISSGFFGGLALGRVLLLWLNAKVGERLVVYVYAAIALGLEFVVWFVPSLVGNAIAVSFIGLLTGPMYPLAMNHASRTLPRSILTSSMGWIAGFGQAGSALIPFIAGAAAERHGIWSLNPVLVAMTGLMVVIWFLIPNPTPVRVPFSHA